MPLTPGGWTTRIKFDSELILCNSFNFPETQTLIESSGAYAGTMNGASDRAMGSPYLFDYAGVNGQFSFDPSEDQAINLMQWLGSRQSSKAMEATTPGGTATYGTCYLTSMTFSAEENTLMGADVGVWVLRRPLSTDTVGGGAIRTQALETPNVTPVPFWTTQVTPLSSNVVGWSLNASQDLVKKFFCGASTDTDAPEPDYVLVGPLEVQLDVSMIAPSGVLLSSLLLDFTSTTQYIKIGNTTFLTMSNITTTDAQPQIASVGEFYSMNMSYKVHGITTP